MANPSDMPLWDYKLVSMGNPLEPDIELRANILGKHGWELVAIDAGVWIFKRPTSDDTAPTGVLEAIIDETVTLAEAQPPGAGPPRTVSGAAE